MAHTHAAPEMYGRQAKRRKSHGRVGREEHADETSLIVGGMLASVVAGAAGVAVQDRLQVVNLDALAVFAQVENSEPPRPGEERMSRLEARLDNGEFSTAAVLPGREVQLLEDPRYGGKAPARLHVFPVPGIRRGPRYSGRGIPATCGFAIRATDGPGRKW